MIKWILLGIVLIVVLGVGGFYLMLRTTFKDGL